MSLRGETGEQGGARVYLGTGSTIAKLGIQKVRNPVDNL